MTEPAAVCRLYDRPVECSCCGKERDDVVALRCHQEVGVCRGCLAWLRARSGALDVTPILPVLDLPVSIAFYEAAGFQVRTYPQGGYAFVGYDGESAFDLDQADTAMDPATNPAGCYVIVPDVDAWHARLSATALPVTEPADMPWGMREFTLTDPSGNHLRIGQAR